MEVARLRLVMVVIAVAVIAGGVALASVFDAEPIDQGLPTATATASAAPSPSSLSSSAPPLRPTPTTSVLLPDARSLPANELSIETTDGGRKIRFAATLANEGPGPLEVVPDDSRACPAGQRYAVQRLYVDAGDDRTFNREADRQTETRPAGCMVDHPDHDHWHFDAMARYALSEVGATTPISENDKVSFCLRDNIPVPGTTTAQPQHYGDCETRIAVQGISPGWADVYSARLADQYLDLPDGLADGTYCLHTEADPFRLLQEVDSTDNAAVLTVRITGTSVVAAPTNQCRPLPPLEIRSSDRSQRD